MPLPHSPSPSRIPNPLHQHMIPRVRCLLIQHLHRLPTQPHKLSLEPNPPQPRHHLSLPLPPFPTKIILKKKTQRIHIPKSRPLNRNLLYLSRLGELERLRGLEFRGGGEIEVVAVVEDF